MASDGIYIQMKLNAIVNLPADKFDKKIDQHLEYILKQKYGNRCIGDKYIVKKSIELLSRTTGKRVGSHFKGDLTYNVVYAAKVCSPPKDYELECTVKSMNKLGIIATNGPVSVTVPREFHPKDTWSIFNAGEVLNIGDQILVKIIKTKATSNQILAIAYYMDKVVKKDTRDFQIEGPDIMDLKIAVGVNESDELPENFFKSNLLNELHEIIAGKVDEWKTYKGSRYIYSKLADKYGYDFPEYFELLKGFKSKKPTVLVINNTVGAIKAVRETLKDYTLYGYGAEIPSSQSGEVLKENNIIDFDSLKGLLYDFKIQISDESESELEKPIKANLIIANLEIDNSHELFIEIATAILTQAKGGTVLMKVPLLVTELEYQLLAIMSVFYDLSLVKPQASNGLNLSYYLVGKDFKQVTSDNLTEIYNAVEKWTADQKVIDLSVPINDIELPYDRLKEIFMTAYNGTTFNDKIKEQAMKEWVEKNLKTQ